jgi:hypothetical protein
MSVTKLHYRATILTAMTVRARGEEVNGAAVLLEDPEAPFDILDLVQVRDDETSGSAATPGPFTMGETPEPPPQASAVGNARGAEVAVGLVAAVVVGIDEPRRRLSVRLGSAIVEAALDDAVEMPVARTALARGERMIVQREGERWVALGALRTAATPGVDEADEFVVRARRVAVLAAHEFSVATGAASLVLRARGYVETIAEDITSRATSLHKIVGRMIRLN